MSNRQLILRLAIPIILTTSIAGALIGPILLDEHFTLQFIWSLSEFLVVISILAAGQTLLLLGAPHWCPHRPRHKRSIAISLSLGALIAAGVSLGILASILAIFDEWDLVSHLSFITIGALWLIWMFLFAIMFTGQWVHRFRAIYRTLVAGTALELILTIPIDAWVRKRTSCYCGEGTFFALAVGIISTIWLFGPGIILLLVTRHHHRTTNQTLCRACGYDLRMIDSPRCPECGQAIPRKATAPPHTPSPQDEYLPR